LKCHTPLVRSFALEEGSSSVLSMAYAAPP
jgi:hypothetical protein